MSISRRTAIKQVFWVSAGIALLPSCVHTAPASIALKNIQLDSDDEKMLEELTATIIPTTNTPGAREVKAHQFALIMLDDCFDKEAQQKWIAGMKDFKDRFKKSFVKASADERATFLQGIEKEDASKVPAAHFYKVTKRLTIQAYTNSEYYLTKVETWELVPGRFHGSVPVKDLTKKTL